MPLSLSDDVRLLKGVGPSVAGRLEKLGIGTVEDLLFHFPRSYEDRRSVTRLRDARDGQKATFHVRVIEQGSFVFRGRRHPKITVADATGKANLFCFHRNFMRDALPVGATLYLTGAPGMKYRVPAFSQFDYEVDRLPGRGAGSGGTDGPDALRIVPVYPLTAGITQKVLRGLVHHALELAAPSLPEVIPEFIIKGYRFKRRGELLRDVHFPPDMTALRRAREALSYQEFFRYQVVVSLARRKTAVVRKERREVPGALKRALLERLPFRLTAAQERVLGEIEKDLHAPAPMNRLVQGDVGSGKTMVALLASLGVIEGGGQVAFMAPTEVLARQHFGTIREHLEGTGIETEFLSGSTPAAERARMIDRLAAGDIGILVGTHALFSDDVRFSSLDLAVIDEQQKFGVLQRGRLRAKGRHPDCLVLTATPIPRTLSMTLYGDLDISVIDELPPGRGGIETDIVRQAEVHTVYDTVRREVEAGRQAYFIYPVIEESSSDLKNAVEAYEHFKEEVFSDLQVGLLHGRMSDQEKEEVMGRFKAGELNIVVATTVIEVGIDVPNATVMVIEQAERFGLSSIHQLRGRIGRGGHRSYCFLVPDRSSGRESFQRLRILKDTTDGFKIAEWDLKLRGPGELLGRRQSGVPAFLIDSMDITTRLIYRAQQDARRFVEGEAGTPGEREAYLREFTRSEAYRNAMMYFGG